MLIAAGGCRKALHEIVDTAVTCGRVTAIVEDEVRWSPSGVVVWPCSGYHDVEAFFDHPWARRPLRRAVRFRASRRVRARRGRGRMGVSACPERPRARRQVRQVAHQRAAPPAPPLRRRRAARRGTVLRRGRPRVRRAVHRAARLRAARRAPTLQLLLHGEQKRRPRRGESHLSATVVCGRSSAPVWGMACCWSPLVQPKGPARSVGTAVTCGRLPVLVGDEVAWCSPSEVAARPCSDATAPRWPAAAPSRSPRACLARYEQCVEQHGWEHRKWHQHHDVERHNFEQYRVAYVFKGRRLRATALP